MDCTTCKHCVICGDDRYLWCDKDGYRMSIPDYCTDYEEREDSLVATQVWDWR